MTDVATVVPTRAQASRATRRALARVLDLDPDALRDDSPLDDLGADSVARIAFADAVEEALAADGVVVLVDDGPLRDATVVGDLVAAVLAGGADDPTAGAAAPEGPR